jgi:hypothetical protein
MHACCQHLLASLLHCTVDAGTLALRVMGTGQGDGVEQSHAEMFDACWALHQPTCTYTGTWAVLPMPVTASEC